MFCLNIYKICVLIIITRLVATIILQLQRIFPIIKSPRWQIRIHTGETIHRNNDSLVGLPFFPFVLFSDFQPAWVNNLLLEILRHFSIAVIHYHELNQRTFCSFLNTDCLSTLFIVCKTLSCFVLVLDIVV